VRTDAVITEGCIFSPYVPHFCLMVIPKAVQSKKKKKPAPATKVYHLGPKNIINSIFLYMCI